MSLVNTLNQLRYEPALRIQGLGNLSVPLMEVIEYLSHPQEEPELDTDQILGFFNDKQSIRQFATSLWRLGRQIDKLEPKGPGRVAQRRHKDLLAQLEKKQLVIQDFTSQPWRGDEFESVTGSYQPDETPIITGMSEPRVIFNNEIIQLGIIMVSGEDEN